MSQSEKHTHEKEILDKIMSSQNEGPIDVYPELSKITGSVNTGLLLSYLLSFNSGIFCKTDKETRLATSLSENEMRLAKKKLVQFGFISTEVLGLPAKTHYTINCNNIISAINKLKHG